MNTNEIQNLVHSQQKYFQTNQTYSIDFRVQMLEKLKASIQNHEKDIYEALRIDLNKAETESYMSEIGMVYSELNYMIKHVRAFSKKQRVRTPLAQFHARSYQQPCPKGNVLIMSPWNYPFLLTMDPLIDALAAGNTCLLKPSAYAPATAQIIKTVVEETFPSTYVAVVMGGRKENQTLLDQTFHHIFFTGSQMVGKEVLKKASEHFTTVTLELGGKSPCIVEKSADVALASKRIVFGKLLNCGQTCVAPDYIYCDASIYDSLVAALQSELQTQYDHNGKIINEKHYVRLKQLLQNCDILYGGSCNDATLQIEPTLVQAKQDSLIMQDEIFGPILPIIKYEKIEEVYQYIQSKSCPLAFYIFSSDAKIIEHATKMLPFGGGCINDTVIHLASNQMGFGGYMESGMGSYHGKIGFDTFTHYKSIVDKKCWIDLPIRYQPYTKFKDGLIRFFMK